MAPNSVTELVPVSEPTPLLPLETKSAKAPDALAAFQAYNELAQRVGLPMAMTLTPQRRQRIQARIREHGGQDAWQKALANIERSAFLRGNNDRDWRANLDFMLQPTSFTKLVEGHYGNGAAPPSGPGSGPAKESEFDRIGRLIRQGRPQGSADPKCQSQPMRLVTHD